MGGWTLALLAGYAAGVLGAAARYAPPTWGVVAAVLVAGLAGLAGAGALGRRPGAPRGLAVAVMAAAAGVARGDAALTEAVSPPLRAHGRAAMAAPARPVVIEGRLIGDAQPTEYGVAFLVAVSSLDHAGRSLATRGGVRVSVGGELSRAHVDRWRDGRRVRVVVALREPQPYRNPGGADVRLALALAGVTWLASAKSAALVEVLEPGTPLQEAASTVRAHVRARVAKAAGLSPLTAAVVTAILIGDRAGIPPEIIDRLQRAGTFHVIAISGGNIAVLAALLLSLLRVGRLPSRPAALVTCVAMAGYGVVAAGSASVARASLVAVMYLVARVADVRAAPLAVLWTALLGLLVMAPLDLFDAGFLLTSGATLGILLSPQTRPRTPGSPATGAAHGQRAWALRWLASLMRASLAADLALLPVATTVFSRVSVAGLLLNPAAIPLMTLAQVCGLLVAGGTDAAPGLARLAARGAEVAVEGLVASAALVDRWPWLSWRVPPPSLLVVGVYYTAWAVWLASRRVDRRWRARAWLVLASACSVTVATAPPVAVPRALPPPGPAGPLRPSRLTVVFLDVGQGDATLVRFGAGRAWLVDAGGIPGATAFDVGARVVSPALWALGIRRLDTLALTHGDPDHIGGAASVVDDFEPREVWEGVPVPGHPPLDRVRVAAARAGSRWRERRRGETWSLDDVVVRVLHPPPPDWERRRVRNDDSLTLELRVGSVRIVLPGDIGEGVENALAEQLRPAGLTILKVPHHGSAGSSAPRFLDTLRPSLAVVSAGRGNRFGHPSRAAVARYAARGIPILRTDEVGAVALVTDGERFTASTWDGAAWKPAWSGEARPPW